MAVREVLQFGNPGLRAPCHSTEAKGPDAQILEDLRDTLTHLQQMEGMGRGLAAPQIGYASRIIHISMLSRNGFLVNPEIVTCSDETFEVMDGCFSAALSFFGPVKRHRWIHVSYCDAAMTPRQERFQDDMAELIQHEVDHLNGILFIDRLVDPSRIVTRREWERRYRLFRNP